MSPMIERRPWGHFEVLAEGPGYKVKRIVVEPGMRLSLQKHFHRSEHWVVASGTGVITRDGRDFSLSPAESIDIPGGAAHRAANPGIEPLVIVELQRGGYLGEDDILRLEDDFGRVS